MCLWCEVEERVYYSYQEQERKALETIKKVEQEGGPTSDGEDGHDRRRCIWEKKLEYVVARMLRERLAIEMADAELCAGEREEAPAAVPRRFPAPSAPAHLLGAFENTIETLFERLAPQVRAAGSRRKGRRLLPFPPPGSSDS